MKSLKVLALAVIAGLTLASCGNKVDKALDMMEKACQTNDAELYQEANTILEGIDEDDITEEQLVRAIDILMNCEGEFEW